MVSHAANGWIVVLAGMFLHFTLGTLYSFGNLSPYLTSYIRAHTDENYRYTDASWIFAASMAGQGSLMFFGGWIERKIGPRWTVILGGAIMSSGVALTAKTCTQNPGFVVLTYGLLFGIGVGICYSAPFTCAMRWMPDKKGLVAGFVVAGSGVGAFIFNQVITHFINSGNSPTLVPYPDHPDEKYFKADEVKRVPMVFLLLASIYFAIQLIAAIFIVNPSAPTNRLRYQPLEIDDEGDDSLTPQEVLRTAQFWNIWAIFFVNAFTFVFIMTQWKAFGQTFIADDKYLTLCGSLAALFNAGGRIFWGKVADVLDFKMAIILLSTFAAAMLFTLKFTDKLGKLGFLIWVCLLFSSLGGNFAIFPSATSKMFGPTHMGPNYGMVFSSTIVSAVSGSYIMDKAYESWGWDAALDVFAVLSLSGAILGCIFCEPRKTMAKYVQQP